MIVLLLLLPVLAGLSSLILYKHNGKRELLKLDIVQFVYSFVITPMLFIWMKSFMFFLLRGELNLRLTISELFLVDTIFSTIFLYLSAFVAIHSVTKTFNLKRERDPIYDMFQHSEYFHQLLSHAVIFGGLLVLFACLSVANVIVPLQLIHDRNFFYGLLCLGLVGGITVFTGIWNYKAPKAIFMRLMKLLFAFLFMVHVLVYFWFDPGFVLAYGAYWMFFVLYLTLVILSLTAEQPEDESGFLNRLPYDLNPTKAIYYWRFLRLKVKHFITARSKYG